jgi:hypothetical protein
LEAGRELQWLFGVKIKERGLTMNEMPGAGLEPGAAVVVYLHSPREKVWGIVKGLSSAGVFVQGIDLNTFDSWVQMIIRGERNMGLTHVFLPLWRVERIALDETIDDIPSMSDMFYSRVGISVAEYLGIS